MRQPDFLRRFFLLLGLGMCAAAGAVQAFNGPVEILAAESFYGDVAQQIGGRHVRVHSILANPEQDPHMFEAGMDSARRLSAARIVIFNGIDYDPWMQKLLSAGRAPQRVVLDVAALTGRKAGDNPHLWYDPQTMPLLAQAIASQLSAIDSANAADYEAARAAFVRSMQPMQTSVARLRARYDGIAVTATEPVFGYMAQALGFSMRNMGYQLAIMNDTEPAASDVIALEQDLRSRQVRVLFYNPQTANRSATKIRQLAQRAGVPVVGVTETLPPGKRYQGWMLDQLAALERALAASRP